MKYYKTDVIGRFWLHRINNIDTYPHKGSQDKGRLLYSRADKKLYYGGVSEWKVLTGKYDVIGSGTKMLMGSYPLPQNWNINVKNDLIIMMTNQSADIGSTSSGTWSISSPSGAGTHDHGGATYPASDPIAQGSSRISGTVDDNNHTHIIYTYNGMSIQIN